MLLKTPENRNAIFKYLDSINEDTFIEEFVNPFFTSFGFQVYRINTHGPGEHGKDIILSRYIPYFLDTEYVAVQAKAETVTPSNVNEFAHQIDRSLKTTFPSKSGQGELLPNYAIFINSRRHTNDANKEFPNLIDKPQFVRILSQENVCDLIINYGIGPEKLISKLSRADSKSMSKDDRVVYNALMGDPNSIDHLLDHQLPLIMHTISRRMKEMVIDAINLRWEKDNTWSGTVKPMKWFDRYFDFFTERQYPYFMRVLKELTSTTRSYEAEYYTKSIIIKTTPSMWAIQAKEFIYECAKFAIYYSTSNRDIALKKLEELLDSKLVSEKNLKSLMRKAIRLYNLDDDDNQYKRLYEEINEILHPGYKEKLRNRAKRHSRA